MKGNTVELLIAVIAGAAIGVIGPAKLISPVSLFKRG
jgi:large-conductance mechanosensitive channel